MARRRSGSRPPTPRDREDERPDEPRDERLQKVLAAAGVASRRECEELILAGRVEVDRKTITELGTKVDPVRNEIRVDGVALPQPKRVYFALNKPPGVVCTNFDPSGRTRVIDMIPTDQRVFPIGRLDRTSEGLILVTNDGTLANRLTHPRYGVKKTYQVLVAGSPSFEDLELLRRGVRLAEGWAKAESVHVRRNSGKSCEMLIVLREGRNREIRRMLARIEHKVLRLRRISVGSIQLGPLPLGAHRKLTVEEVEALEEDVRQARRERRQQRKAKEATEQLTGGENEGGEELGEALPTPRRKEAGGRRSGGPKGQAPRRDPRQRPKPKVGPPRPGNRGPVQHPAGLRIGDDDGPDGDDEDFSPGADLGGEDFGAGDFGSEDFGGDEFFGGGDEGHGSAAGVPAVGGGRPGRGKRPFRPGGGGGGGGGRGGKFGKGRREGRPAGGQASGGQAREYGGHGGQGGGRPAGGRPSGGRPGGKFGRGGGGARGEGQGGGGGRGKRPFGGGPKGKKRRGGRS